MVTHNPQSGPTYISGGFKSHLFHIRVNMGATVHWLTWVNMGCYLYAWRI